jgi:NADH:ubiquinone oxidoreductase subunit 6 (subunit J)
MSIVTFLFFLFMLLAAVGGVAILLSKNVFKSAIYLLVTLLSIASLYALLYAELLAVAQILVYAGGITVIIIFGVMLTTRVSGKPLVVTNTHLVSGGLAGIGMFILLISYLTAMPSHDRTLTPQNISGIAFSIFSQYSLPFEVAGLMLLIALIGAAVITSHLKSKM